MKVWVETTPSQRLQKVFSSKENVQEFWKDVYKDEFGGKRLKIVDGKFGVTPELRLMRVEPYEPVALAYELEVDEYYAEKPAKKPKARKPDPEPPLEQIKPCQKCGSDKVWTVHPAYDGGAYVACRTCGYDPQRETWAPTDARAIYKWNRLERSN